ncbi:uncharacterized protein LOC125683366 isoform X3 [Ostrea edulis]|uniref:uncharacterized protein LOC125683366 isoform X3 n=1 Tax=Ostrea edulis TaxID=37623 RepID=UPI0024AF6D26|nr:uncharacterized protein LOC125683366 isoform X3 [Ostrea edulis]
MNYQKTYMNHIHSSSLLYQLSTMWKTQTLCDAIIRTGSVITKAHRVVLVAACPMLQSMENAAAGSHLEVRLAADIKQESINTFLQYLYEGFMTLNEENYKDIEKISRLLQVENAIKCCADFSKCINVSSANQYRYNYPDQLEFKHVRTTELQKVQERHPKRNTDRPISPGSKRPRFQGHRSPLSDSRTHDMSGMKESYTVNDPWDRVPRLGSHTPTSVHIPSQQPGVIDIVEDSIELLQTEPPSKRPGEDSREVRKVQSTVGVSVASQRDAPSDVQIVNVPGASDVPSQKPIPESSTFIPSSPSSSDSSSLKERPPHFSSQSYPPKTDLDKPTSNMDPSSNVDVASQRHRPPDILAGSQPAQPYPVSITASPRSVPQSFQQKPFAAGSAIQAETMSPGAAQRGPKPQTISRVESMEKASPMDRPPDTGSQTRDQNNRLSPDISIVKVENELGPEETGILDMYVADAGGGGMGTSHMQKEEDHSDYDVEEPPGDMHKDEMSNESGNMSMDQSGNWYMGNFRDGSTHSSESQSEVQNLKVNNTYWITDPARMPSMLGDTEVRSLAFGILDKSSANDLQILLAPRKVPLVSVDEGFYNDVVINPTCLNLLEVKARSAKNPAAFLLNKILEFVFTDDELKMSKGVKGLDEHRINAIREYLNSKYVEFGVRPLHPMKFTGIVQNKIGNLRHQALNKHKRSGTQ